MLQEQSVKLQNVIVFKCVVCLLVGAFLFWYLPISYEEVDTSAQNLVTATQDLEHTVKKLQDFERFQSTMDSVYRAYSETMDHSPALCKVTTSLADQYDALGQRFRLNTSPVTEIGSMPKITKFYDSKYVKIVGDDITVSFSAQGFKHAISFARAAYQILPTGSIVDAIHIMDDNVVTPDSVRELNILSQPDFIEGKIKMEVREVRAVSKR